MRQIKKKIRLLAHQVQFINDVRPNGTVGLVGGFRAGKTYAAVHKAVKLALMFPGEAGALCEPRGKMIRTVLVPTIKKVFAEDFKWIEGVHYKYRKSNPESIIIFTPCGRNHTIYLLGAEKFDSIAGMTLSWFGFDEADRCTSREIAIAAFNELSSRLTTGSRHAFCTSTPEGFDFLYYYFVENGFEKDGITPKADRILYRAETLKNPYVPFAYIERVRANYPPKQAEAYLKGEFINMASGNVYYAWDRTLNAHTKTISDFQHTTLQIGMDFNVDNMSAVVCAHDAMTGKTYVLEEITGVKNTEEMIRRIKKDYAYWAKFEKGITIYPDSAGVSGSANSSISSITMLKQAGFECKFPKKHFSIMKQRVPAVNAQFCSQKQVNGEWVLIHRLFVNIQKCPVLVKGLDQQGFAADGNPDKSKGIDHCLDALGYFIAFEFPVTGMGSITSLK